MTEKLDISAAAVEFATCVSEVMAPPASGAPMDSLVAAYLLKAVLKQAGYVIVPRKPTKAMEEAFQSGWFKPFDERYTALLEASWPKITPDIHEKMTRSS